jgi:two-component system chemotaxis response regulator CheY
VIGPNPLVKMKVLVVDDSLMVRKIMIRALQECGFSEIREAVNGLKAIEAISDGFKPELITLDVNMPEMDGIECLPELRKVLSSEDTKILMATTEGYDEIVNKAMSLGASDFIVKPFSKEDIAAKIHQLFPSK